MSQFNAPARRSGGSIDVYTGLLFAAFVVLLAGVVLLGLRNLEHSGSGNQQGGLVKLIN